MKEEKELVLYPNKNGTVKTLIEEAAKHVEFSEDGSHQLRMVAIQGYKIAPGPREDTELERKHRKSKNQNWLFFSPRAGKCVYNCLFSFLHRSTSARRAKCVSTNNLSIRGNSSE